MSVGRTLFGGSPYLGVYLRVGETAAFGPPSTPGVVAREVERALGIEVVRTTIFDCEVVGALVVANSNGIVVGEAIEDGERKVLEAVAPVTVVRTRQSALGNNVLANDRGALVHPELTNDEVAAIGTALHVPAERGTIAGLGTVGMAGVATNQGVVVHPKATDHEVAKVEQLLGVPVHRSTANFGVPVVGACVVANARGMLVGRPTTPVELVHIQEGLRILE